MIMKFRPHHYLTTTTAMLIATTAPVFAEFDTSAQLPALAEKAAVTRDRVVEQRAAREVVKTSTACVEANRGDTTGEGAVKRADCLKTLDGGLTRLAKSQGELADSIESLASGLGDFKKGLGATADIKNQLAPLRNDIKSIANDLRATDELLSLGGMAEFTDLKEQRRAAAENGKLIRQVLEEFDDRLAELQKTESDITREIVRMSQLVRVLRIQQSVTRATQSAVEAGMRREAIGMILCGLADDPDGRCDDPGKALRDAIKGSDSKSILNAIKPDRSPVGSDLPAEDDDAERFENGYPTTPISRKSALINP